MLYIYNCISTNIDLFHIVLKLAYNIVIMINIVISIIRHEKPVAQYTVKHAISELEIQMIRVNILVCIKLSIIKYRKNVTYANCRNYVFSESFAILDEQLTFTKQEAKDCTKNRNGIVVFLMLHN